jgi:hypothetical protein
MHRSYLFAPGHNAKLLRRVFEAGADAVILDLEGVEAILRGAYWSPKNLRTRADLRATTRRNGSENTT